MVIKALDKTMVGKQVRIIYSENMGEAIYISEDTKEKIFEKPYGVLTSVGGEEYPFDCQVDFQRRIFPFSYSGGTVVKFRYSDVELVRINN